MINQINISCSICKKEWSINKPLKGSIWAERLIEYWPDIKIYRNKATATCTSCQSKK
jgi:hypothetical protein